jgi:hypothetical protein
LVSEKYIALLLLLLAGCGGDHLNDDIPLPDAGSEAVSGGGYNPGPGGSNSTGSVAKTGERYTTTSGGAFYAVKKVSLSFSYSEYLTGTAAYGGTIYLATRQYLVSGTQYRIYSLSNGSSTQSLQCSWIHYGTTMDGLGVDDSYFYFIEGYNATSLKRFSRSGCGSSSSISVPGAPFPGDPFTISGGKVYYGGAPGGSVYGPQYLLESPLGGGSLNTLFSETIFGSYTTSWSTLKGIAEANSFKWAIFSHDYQSYALWQFSESGARSVGKIPSQVLGTYLYYPTDLVPISNTELVLVIGGSSTHLIYLDVEGF